MQKPGHTKANSWQDQRNFQQDEGHLGYHFATNGLKEKVVQKQLFAPSRAVAITMALVPRLAKRFYLDLPPGNAMNCKDGKRIAIRNRTAICTPKRRFNPRIASTNAPGPAERGRPQLQPRSRSKHFFLRQVVPEGVLHKSGPQS
jgi:hypothetical protein